MNYSSAISEIIARRRDELAAASLRYLELLKADEKLHALDSSYRTAALDGDEKQAQSLDAAIKQRLRDLGEYERVYPAVHCEKCEDTGFCGTKICDCVKRYAISKNEIRFPLYDFSSSTPSIFGEHSEEYAKRQKILETLMTKFPESNKRTVVLLGSAGTGKTFLASCCANAALSKGASVTFVSAFEFVEKALRYHVSPSGAKDEGLSRFIDADLLVIDDLGTEPIYKNVTKEYFFLIIGERQLSRKYTIFTSNLTIDEIAARYGERTASRLFSGKECLAFEFNYADARKIKL
jgi:DNA replication protein DnaC